jgi:uncharacterized glyoxalase superfamily protein PhnB
LVEVDASGAALDVGIVGMLEALVERLAETSIVVYEEGEAMVLEHSKWGKFGGKFSDHFYR